MHVWYQWRSNNADSDAKTCKRSDCYTCSHASLTQDENVEDHVEVDSTGNNQEVGATCLRDEEGWQIAKATTITSIKHLAMY